MTNSSSALIKAMLIASASSMITYKTMRLWKNNKDAFLGSLLSLIMNHMGDDELDPLDLFQGPLFGQKGFGQTEIEEINRQCPEEHRAKEGFECRVRYHLSRME